MIQHIHNFRDDKKSGLLKLLGRVFGRIIQAMNPGEIIQKPWSIGSDSETATAILKACVKDYLMTQVTQVYEDDSHPAVDLLEKLLETDPLKRITAEQALEHPFLKQFERAELERKKTSNQQL